jgi:hypothetical protein
MDQILNSQDNEKKDEGGIDAGEVSKANSAIHEVTSLRKVVDEVLLSKGLGWYDVHFITCDGLLYPQSNCTAGGEWDHPIKKSDLTEYRAVSRSFNLHFYNGSVLAFNSALRFRFYNSKKPKQTFENSLLFYYTPKKEEEDL